jgi:thiol-disulfide isomerase/thioredoxin
MKKTTINIVTGMLCPLFKNSAIVATIYPLLMLALITDKCAAQKAFPAPLTIGQYIPEQFWSQALTDISAKSDKIFMINSLKGRPFIIDFWASWCNPCLANMPHLDSLSRVGETSFHVIMANTGGRIDSLKNLREFVKGYLKDKKDFNSPLVLYSPVLNAYFPHHVVPHYIWIGPDGRVKAITDHRQINPANIKTFVSGGNLDLPLKTR